METEVEYTALVSVKVELESGEVVSVVFAPPATSTSRLAWFSVTLESETDQPDELFDRAQQLVDAAAPFELRGWWTPAATQRWAPVVERVAWSLAAALALATAGLAGTASGSTAAAHGYRYTLTVTGSVKRSGTYTYSLHALPACSVIAKGYLFSSPREFRLPAGGSISFGLDWLIQTGYTGPGTYAKKSDFLGVALTARGKAFVPGSATKLS